MHVDGLSRTEARHLAAAKKASMGGGDKVGGGIDLPVILRRGGEEGWC